MKGMGKDGTKFDFKGLKVSRITPYKLGSICETDKYETRSLQQVAFDMITGRRKPVDAEGEKRIAHGHKHEDFNRRLFEMVHRCRIIKPGFLVSRESEWFLMETDGFGFYDASNMKREDGEPNLDGADFIFEAKMCRLTDEVLAYEQRRKEGLISDENMVVKHLYQPYVDQLHMEMWMTGRHVSVLSLLECPYDVDAEAVLASYASGAGLPENVHLFTQIIYFDVKRWERMSSKIEEFCNEVYFPMLERYFQWVKGK